MTEYNYTKTPLALDSLTKEIQDSSITIALDHISLLGSDLSVFFKADISIDEKTILDEIIDNHNGIPLPTTNITSVKLVEDITTPKDSDGSPLSRTKVTTTGWHYQLHGIEFETSKLNSAVSKDEDNINFGFCSMKFYELISDVETLITGENLNQEYLDAHCIKTILDWEPDHDLEIIGGMLKLISIPTEDLRMWTVGVPDIPKAYGGSKPFAVNINLRYIGIEDGVKVDGRAPKYLTYSATYHTTKIRMLFRHPVGFKHNLHMIFELFKS